MPVVDESITINKPRSEVFAFFLDPENVRMCSSNLSDYELVFGDGRSKGSVFRGAVKIAGKTMPFTAEVTEYEDGSRVVQRSTDAKIPYTLEIRYEDAAGDATSVSWHQETESLGGFFGKLADAVVVKMYERDVRSNLEKAKTLLEA